MPAIQDALPVGTCIDEFEVREILGRGGFGITYLAHDHQLNRAVALKEYLPDDYAIRDDAMNVIPSSKDNKRVFDWGLDRFSKEARTLAQFRHPVIVSVQRLLADKFSTAFIVMDYIEGGNLDDAVSRNGPYDFDGFKLLFSHLLDGCEAIHEEGILHRDIKPLNIMLVGKNDPVLIDFGAARELALQKHGALSRIYADGYSPPEQYSDDQVQGSYTDIYALAATAYFSLTGRDPRSAPARTAGDNLPPLAEVTRTAIPEKFCAAIDWGLQLKVPDRPQTIEQWREAMPPLVEEVIEIQGIPITRRTVVLGSAALGGIAAAGGAAYYLTRPEPEPDLSDTSRPLKLVDSADLNEIVEADPFADIAITSTGAIIAAQSGASPENARLSSVKIDKNLNIQGEVFKGARAQSYGRTIVPLPDGGAIVAGLADAKAGQRLERISNSYVVRLDAANNAIWQKTYGEGAINDIAVDFDQERIYFASEDINMGRISTVTVLDFDGQQQGEPLEMGKKSDESVERVISWRDDQLAVLNFRRRSDTLSSSLVNNFRLVNGEVQQIWSESDVAWQTDSRVAYSQPHDMVAAANDLFVGGRALPDDPVYKRDDARGVASYLARIDGETGQAMWRKTGPFGTAETDPFSAIKTLAVHKNGETQSVFVGEFFQKSATSRIFQVDGQGELLNEILIGSEDRRFIIDALKVDDKGGYAIGFNPVRGNFQLQVHRLEWA